MESCLKRDMSAKCAQLMRWSCWRPDLWKLRGFEKASCKVWLNALTARWISHDAWNSSWAVEGLQTNAVTMCPAFQAQRKACLLQAMAASGHSTVNSEFCNISQKFVKIIGLWNGGCKMTIRRTITTRQEGGGGVAPSPPTLSSFRW